MKVCCVKPIVGAFVVAAFAGAFAMGRYSTPTENTEPLPLFNLDATSSAIGEEFSMATGPVSPEADGVFVLDHSSGLLQCNVIYPRSGAFGAAFQCNVKEVLQGQGKNGKYLMVVGSAQFPGASNRPAFGNCVVYVLDQSNGAYAAFGIPFNKSMTNANSPQMGVMVPIARGQARVALDRDALR